MQRQSYQLKAGSIANLKLVTLELPDPVGDEVTIAVKAIGLNFADIFAMFGLLELIPVEDGSTSSLLLSGEDERRYRSSASKSMVSHPFLAVKPDILLFLMFVTLGTMLESQICHPIFLAGVAMCVFGPILVQLSSQKLQLRSTLM